MSAPILQIEFTEEAKVLITKLASFPEVLMPAMRRGIATGAEEAASRIQQQRLTGEGPFPIAEHMLGVRSGRLRQSVRADVGAIEGNTVSASIGTNVRYAAVHEFGFEGDVQVRPFFRKNRRADRYEKFERVSRKTGRSYNATVKTASGVSPVKAHKRHMKIPERAPFGYGLADSEQLITNAVTSELETAWRGVQ